MTDAEVRRVFGRAPRDLGRCVPIWAGATGYVLDAIMANAPADEPLVMSVARLSRCVAWMGYHYVTALSAWLAYRRFPQLKKKREREKDGN